MHCVFSYDLAAEGERRHEIEERIIAILSTHRYAKRLSTFYIVYIQNQDDWNNLLRELTDYLKPMPERAHFIMSPPMIGGLYNGLLGANDWGEINEITRL